METYFVRVGGPETSFSAIHLVTFEDGSAENLHGHSFRVAAEVEGPLDRNGLVLDFVRLKRLLGEVVAELDHRVILPTRSPALAVEVEAEEVQARLRDRRWVFPEKACALLPIANATVELLAAWIAARLLAAIGPSKGGRPAPAVARLRVEVEESPGQTAACEVVP